MVAPDATVSRALPCAAPFGLRPFCPWDGQTTGYIGPRPGDSAEMVYLELVDFEPVATPFAMRRAERAEEPEAADEE